MRYEMLEFIREFGSVSYGVMDTCASNGIYQGVVRLVMSTNLSSQEAEEKMHWFRWYTVEEFVEEYKSIIEEYPELCL